ncbi:galanin receptor type 1-like [Oppia nitens]|uniref:galanin receptor type 1-like n=1 Tax=Oppia nitens TaxID=1686743 RepID=UPI0023DBD5EA|nr:galanin receptor type 1-like [Oppia nitens]
MDPIWVMTNNVTEAKLMGRTQDDTVVFTSLDALNRDLQIYLVILYSITAILAFVGNVTVIFVLSNGRRCPISLRKFLINLSLADVSLALFSIPFTYTDFMLGYWIFPNFMCSTAQFVQVLSVFVSVYTLTIIGIERYIATIHSFNCANHWFKHHTNLMLIIGWIFGALLGSVQWWHSRAVPFSYRNETYVDCREEWDEAGGKAYTVVIFLMTFLMPLIM